MNPDDKFRFIKIETVKNGYIAYASHSTCPNGCMADDVFVFGTPEALANWIEDNVVQEFKS